MMMDMGMKMYFHGGYDEVILFDFWRINSVGGLIGSMIAWFVLGIVYEGLKFVRDALMRRHFQRSVRGRYNTVQPRDQQEVDPAPMGSGDDIEHLQPTNQEHGEQRSEEPASIRIVETSILSRGHFFLTLLHMVQVSLAYALMLVFMTFNSWLCLSVILGATVGYFIFGWRRTVMIEEADHCH